MDRIRLKQVTLLDKRSLLSERAATVDNALIELKARRSTAECCAMLYNTPNDTQTTQRVQDERLGGKKQPAMVCVKIECCHAVVA